MTAIYGIPTPTDERDVGRYGWRFTRRKRIRLGAPGADGDSVNLEGDPRLPPGSGPRRGGGSPRGDGLRLREAPDVNTGISDDDVDGEVIGVVD